MQHLALTFGQSAQEIAHLLAEFTLLTDPLGRGFVRRQRVDRSSVDRLNHLTPGALADQLPRGVSDDAEEVRLKRRVTSEGVVALEKAKVSRLEDAAARSSSPAQQVTAQPKLARWCSRSRSRTSDSDKLIATPLTASQDHQSSPGLSASEPRRGEAPTRAKLEESFHRNWWCRSRSHMTR